jgi:uncharacterized membrane protein YphA (DoxX/SURF4 family)
MAARQSVSRAWESWQRFWFEPESTAPLVLVRVAFGVLVLAWGLSLAPDLIAFLGPEGVVPDSSSYEGPALWTLLDVFNSDAAVIALYVAMLAGGVCLIFGFQSRLAALIVFVVLTSFDRRNVWMSNSGDGLVRILSLILVLAPAGNSIRERAPWALRLLQVQVSILYLAAVWAKVRGVAWNDGTAVSYAMRLEDIARFQLPHGLTQSELVANLMTYGTLAVELALGVLIWNKKLRPYVLLAGVGLHLSIDLTMRIGFFSWAVLVAYLAFVPPEQAQRVIDRARETTSSFRRIVRRSRSAPVRARS